MTSFREVTEAQNYRLKYGSENLSPFENAKADLKAIEMLIGAQNIPTQEMSRMLEEIKTNWPTFNLDWEKVEIYIQSLMKSNVQYQDEIEVSKGKVA